MSHEVIKSIKIDEKKMEVIISGDIDNSFPKDYTPSVHGYLTYLLVTKGKVAAINEILRLYWSGGWRDGTANAYSKSVAIYKIKHPDYVGSRVGVIKDVDVAFGPIEELPKYANYADSYTENLIKKRLSGWKFDPESFVPVVTITHDELSDALYQEYLSFKTRKKESHYICVRDRDSLGNGEQFFCQPRGKYYTHCYTIKEAMIFDSWETAALMFHKYCNGSEIRSKLTTHAVRKVSDYDE